MMSRDEPTPILLRRKDSQAFQRGFEKGVTPLFATEKENAAQAAFATEEENDTLRYRKAEVSEGVVGVGGCSVLCNPLMECGETFPNGGWGFWLSCTPRSAL